MIRTKTQFIKILVLLIIGITFKAQAQQAGTTLAQQYEEVVGKAGSYQGHKEIKEYNIRLLWKNTMDSLQKERQLLKESRAKLSANDQAVAGLKSELNNKEQSLIASKERVDEVSLLGIAISKGSYNVIMWGLVFLLAAGLTFTFMKTKASITEASYRSNLYNDLFDEFRDYKTKANEKEKKLARDLQTERNKIADLSGYIR